MSYFDDFKKKVKSEAKAAVDEAGNNIADKAAQTKIEVIRSKTMLPDTYPGADPDDPLDLGKDLTEYTDEEYNQYLDYEDQLNNEFKILDQQAQCNVIGEKFKELADAIDELSDKFDALVDKLIDKITNFLGIAAIEAKFKAEYAALIAAMKQDFPSINDFLKSIDLPISEELKNLAALGYDTYVFAQKIQDLKNKYGGGDAVLDAILNDPTGFLTELGSDLEALCKDLPTWEKAKYSSVKVRVAPFGLEGPNISLKEIIAEGASPFITRFEDIMKDLGYDIEKVHDYYDKYTSQADGKHSHTDL